MFLILLKVNLPNTYTTQNMNNSNHILATASKDDVGRGSILYGIRASRAMNMPLVIFAVYPEGSGVENTAYKSSIESFIQEVCEKELFLNYKIHIANGTLVESAAEYATENKSATVIFGLHPPKGFSPFYGVKFIKATKALNTPFIVVQNEEPAARVFEYLYVPISHKKEGKEKLVWLESFCCNNNIKVKLVPAKTSDIASNIIVQNHLNFAIRQLETVGIPFEVIQGEQGIYKINQEAIQMAAQNKDGIVIITATKHYGPDQELLGPPELKSLINKEMVPVMCVNPRKDLTVVYSKY